MRKITIGFSYPKKFKIGAKAIALWINEAYSHVFVSWNADKISRQLVYHAAHGKVHFMSMDRLLSDNVVKSLYQIEITDEQYIELVQQCIDLAGESYGYLELFKIIIKDICDSVGFQCKIIENSRGYICSELLASLLAKLGAKFDRPHFLLRPDHIEQSLIEMKAKKVEGLHE